MKLNIHVIYNNEYYKVIVFFLSINKHGYTLNWYRMHESRLFCYKALHGIIISKMRITRK